MHTLHVRAAAIFKSWADEEKEAQDMEAAQLSVGTDTCSEQARSSLWTTCWCPLLQG